MIYSDLIARVGRYLNRTDLVDDIPGFIENAEARFSRVLRTPEMENIATATITGERFALPSDFLEVRSVFLDSDPRVELEPVTLGTLRSKYAQQTTGQPQAYAMTDGQFLFGPAPDTSYAINLTYFQKIPALSSSRTSNWLLSSHPDVYLYASLVQAEAYLWNDDRLGVWKSALDEALGELTVQSNRKRHGNAPLRLRPSVYE